ncbi:MAG TPA: response regulator [Steroidobacteraceae bacterium]
MTPVCTSDEVSQPRPPVILVIEDELLVRLSIADYLRDAGYVVIEVSSASEALTIIASQTQIDLVFSDINLPGWMDGEVLANWLSIRRPDIPVILTSGAITPSLRRSPDVFRFISKPYALMKVEEEIKALLAKARATKGS